MVVKGLAPCGSAVDYRHLLRAGWEKVFGKNFFSSGVTARREAAVKMGFLARLPAVQREQQVGAL